MSNFPVLSDDAKALLIEIEDLSWRARGLRIDRKRAGWRELTKAGLIHSRHCNANPLLNAAAGNYYLWIPTPAGAEIALALRKE